MISKTVKINTKTGGRNNKGRISTFHKGGGHKGGVGHKGGGGGGYHGGGKGWQ